MGNWLTRRVAFWKSGLVKPLKVIVVGILVSILPAIGIIRDVALSPENKDWYLLKYVPKWPWYWWVIIILIVLIIVIEEASFRANRSSLSEQRSKYLKSISSQRERHRQELMSAGIQELVSAKRAALQPPEPIRQQQAPETPETAVPDVKPVLECVDAETVKVRLDSNNRITKDERGSNQAALAYFHLKPLPNTESWVRVRAIISFHDLDRNRKERGKDGVWHKHADKEITFSMGDTHPLVIGLLGTKVATYEHALKRSSRGMRTLFLSPQIDVLDGKNFRVSVQLIGREGGELLIDETFEFSLVTEPEFKLEEIGSGLERSEQSKVQINRTRVREELLPLLREGHQLEREIHAPLSGDLSEQYANPRRLDFKCSTWSEQVDRSISLYLDGSFISRFHAQDEQAGPSWTAKLHGRVIELEKIVRELAD